MEALASCVWHYTEMGTAHGCRIAASTQGTVTLVHNSKLMPHKMIQMLFKGFTDQEVGKGLDWGYS